MIVFGTADAGPAQYLSEVIQSIRTPYLCFSSVISAKVFANNNIKETAFKSDLIPKERVNQIIVGSSLSNMSIDFQLLKWGKQNKVKTIMIIEHWTLFKERIEALDESNFPSEFWVNDASCKQKLIELGINQNSICSVGNPTLEKLEKSPKIKQSKNNAILFVSEHMSDPHFQLKQKYGFDEHCVLEAILKHKPPQTPLFIKLHPEEKRDKYKTLCQAHGVELLQEVTKEVMGKYEIIIGMNSFLLIELALMGSTVYTYRPNQRERFIGEELHLSYNLQENELACLLQEKVHFKCTISSASFLGSTHNILKRLSN